VSENATEQAIIDRLDLFCNDLGPLQPECDSFLAIYVPKLINWTITNENPQVFCTQVGICSSQKSTYPGKTASRLARREEVEEDEDNEEDEEYEEYEDDDTFEEAQSSSCQVCQLIVTYVEQLVAANNTVSEIVTQVKDLCNQFAGPFKTPCDQMAAQYIPQLVKWIVNKENPQAFCAQIGLC